MATSNRRRSLACSLACGITVLASLAAPGCQVNTGGQTLPSGYYLTDDVQYFAPGPQFPLQNEAAAQALQRAEAARTQAQQNQR